LANNLPDRLDIFEGNLVYQFEHEACVIIRAPAGMRHHHLQLMYPEIKQLADKAGGRMMAFVDSKDLLEKGFQHVQKSVGIFINTYVIRFTMLVFTLPERLKADNTITPRIQPLLTTFAVDSPATLTPATNLSPRTVVPPEVLCASNQGNRISASEKKAVSSKPETLRITRVPC
ncbi:hypothetical protein Tco_0517219, partial [Tanacetum coccineum]